MKRTRSSRPFKDLEHCQRFFFVSWAAKGVATSVGGDTTLAVVSHPLLVYDIHLDLQVLLKSCSSMLLCVPSVPAGMSEDVVRRTILQMP